MENGKNGGPRDAPPSLPAARAFVVHIAAAVDPEHGGLCGRIEHITSGMRARFDTWAGVEDFILAVLRTHQEKEEP